MSASPGSTLIPRVSIVGVPAGTATAGARPDGHDPLAGDQNDAVFDRRAFVSVDDAAAHERERRLGRRLGRAQNAAAIPASPMARTGSGCEHLVLSFDECVS